MKKMRGGWIKDLDSHGKHVHFSDYIKHSNLKVHFKLKNEAKDKLLALNKGRVVCTNDLGTKACHPVRVVDGNPCPPVRVADGWASPKTVADSLVSLLTQERYLKES